MKWHEMLDFQFGGFVCFHSEIKHNQNSQAGISVWHFFSRHKFCILEMSNPYLFTRRENSECKSCGKKRKVVKMAEETFEKY